MATSHSFHICQMSDPQDEAGFDELVARVSVLGQPERFAITVEDYEDLDSLERLSFDIVVEDV